jgi:hypothetical protein
MCVATTALYMVESLQYIGKWSTALPLTQSEENDEINEHFLSLDTEACLVYVTSVCTTSLFDELNAT